MGGVQGLYLEFRVRLKLDFFIFRSIYGFSIFSEIVQIFGSSVFIETKASGTSRDLLNWTSTCGFSFSDSIDPIGLKN